MKKSEGRGLPIFYRLLIAFLGVVVIICGALTLVFYAFSVKAIERSTRERILQEFVVLDHYFRNDFEYDMDRELRILSSDPLIDDFMMSSDLDREISARVIERLFLQHLNYMNDLLSISFVDYSGKEIIRVDRTGRVKQYRDMSGSKLFSQIESGPAGSISTSGFSRNEEDGISLSIGIGKTDADIGKLGGAIVTEYNVEEFFRKLDRIEIYGTNPVWVFAPDGQILKQPVNSGFFADPRALFLQDPQVVPKLITSKGDMIAYQDFSVITGVPLMRIAIVIPSSLLLEDIRLAMKFLLIVFLLSVVLISVIALYLSRYFSSPVVELANAAARLAKGDLSTEVKVKTTGEVQMLVESFNRMAKDLKETTVSRNELELKVEERTRQLVEAQEELVRKEKLSILGQLSGIVGHELRNPLGVISNAVYFLNTVMSDADETVREYLVIIKNEVDNSQRIITDLLDFSRTRTPQAKPVTALELIRSSLEKCVVPKNVKVEMETPEELPLVRVDPFQMTQVFQNLITNAVQAMPEGGALKITVQKSRSAEEQKCKSRDGDFVEISVSDTGVGISPENMKKIFQPLFTTKAKGIGLGMVVCKKMTEANGGEIDIKSKLSEGTTFTITLPVNND